MSGLDKDPKPIAKDEYRTEQQTKTSQGSKHPGHPRIKTEEDTDTSKDSFELCHRCDTISIEELLNPSVEVPESGIQVIALGKPNTKAFHSGCPLCCLFISVATAYKRRYDLELRLFDRIPQPDGSDNSRGLAVDDRFLAVVRQNERLVYDFRIAHEIGSNGLLIASPTRAPSRQVRAVKPFEIDYDLVNYWLEQCINRHGLVCNPIHNGVFDLQLHVIDCFEDTIKVLPQHQEYVALSYVWGRTAGSTRFDTCLDDSTSQCLSAYNVPLTIKDAMRVVTNIGRRYLWVDRYCIPHTDATRRAEAILNMNQIYAEAVVTIVALHGDHSDAGLPGVSTVCRQGNQRVSVRGGHLISSLSPLTAVIKESTWSTRGWTFQEARLSKRCLFLSRQQVYYACQTHTSSESLPNSASCSAAKHLNPRGLDPSMFASESKLIFSSIFLDRLSYSQRTLTHQNDALDAFRGILRIHPFITFWGVPVAHQDWKCGPTICFAMGLLWARGSLATFEAHMPKAYTGSYQRRSGFPTWSWASVIGEIFQFGTNESCTYRNFFRNDTKDQSERLHPAFEVRLKDPEMDLRSAISLATTNMLPESSKCISIKGDLVRVKRERNSSVKVGKPGHIRYRFCGEDDGIMSDVYILPRIDLDEDDVDCLEPQDALILIDWRDGGKRAQRRFILMLLKWVEESVAERVGLLGRYYEKWNISFLERLWRRRVEFELR